MSRKHLKTAAKSSFWKGDLDVVDQIVVVAQPDPLPHDKHPRNWSRPRKLFIAFLTCNLLVAVEMYGSLYAGVQRQIQNELASSRFLATLGMGLVNLGIAIGSLIGAPLSSLIGRRLTYILSAVCFTAFTAGSSFSSSITTLLVFRFIAAFFGATAFPNYVLTLADLFTPEDKTPILAIALTVTCSTPTFGPIPGSYLGSLAPWPWTFALSAFWAGILAVILLFIPETDLNVIRRYHRKLKEGKSTWEVLRPQLVTKNTWQKLLTPLTLLILEPIILWTALYHAFIYGLFFILLQAIPFIYQHNYQFTPGNIGLVFLAPWIGNLIGAILYFGLLQPYHAHQTRRLQSRNTKSLSQDPLAYVQVALKPEARLPRLLGGVAFLSSGLLWFALTSDRPQLHFMVPISSGLFMGIGMPLYILSLFAYQTELYPSLANSVLITNLFIRAFFAAFCPSFGLHIYEELGAQKGGLVLFGVSLLGLPMGAVLWMCGGRVRKMSKRAAQDEAFVMRDVELDFNFGGCSRSMSCTKPRQSNLNASSLIDDFESLERLQSKPNRSYIPSKTPLYELDDDEDEDFRDSSVRYSRRLPPHTPTTLPELRRSLDAGTITPGGVVTRHHEDETNNNLGLNATATAVNLDLELVSGATGRTSSSLELVQEIPRTSRTRDGITGS